MSENTQMPIYRYLHAPIQEDLLKKMVFLAGPRQVGKTTLAKEILDKHRETGGIGAYYSWDKRADRGQIRAGEWPGGEALVVIDELHKYRFWKRLIKGEFDAHRERLRFLLTGSARMDVYRKGGDSLQGRYHHYRLHPFTQSEIADPHGRVMPEPGSELRFTQPPSQEILASLLAQGGFPEPFLSGSTRQVRRWHNERLDRFFREDVRDLENVRDLSSLELFAEMLNHRVGSPLSLNSVREDLEVSHRAVSHWLDVFGRLYFVFGVPPFAHKAVRSIRKMPKVYLWDYCSVSDPGARFENLVALHLLKLVHFLTDYAGHRVQLSYLRDTSGREVDFLVAWENKPWFAVEVKLSKGDPSPALEYFGSRLKIPYLYQISQQGDYDRQLGNVRLLCANRFLTALP